MAEQLSLHNKYSMNKVYNSFPVSPTIGEKGRKVEMVEEKWQKWWCEGERSTTAREKDGWKTGRKGSYIWG